MKKLVRILLFLSATSAALALGFRHGLGMRASQEKQVPPIQTSVTVPAPAGQIEQLPPTEPGDNSQINLLVVQVDNLELSRPNPVSMWLVIYHQQVSERLTMIPVYWQMGENATQIAIREAFQLDDAHHLGKGFLDLFLDAYDTSLNGYILVDTASIGRVVNLLGGITLGESTYSGEQLAGVLDAHIVEQRHTLDSQVTTIRSICRQFSHIPRTENPGEIIRSLLDGLVIHAIDSQQTAALYQKLSESAPLNCDFPTLELQAPSQP